jgi:DNA-binding transcriptional LysR family regulator
MNMNWEDVRLFLTLVRNGSARKTASEEGLSHSTIKRRVEQLETDLGVRLFDRDVRGYRLTAAGETMLISVTQAEGAFLAAQRKLQGRDTELSGEIRLTTSNIIATHLLMQEFVDFGREYPEIDLNITTSSDIFDLSRREADVALRVMPLDASPPEDLAGKKLVSVKNCYYASADYLSMHDPWAKESSARWIGWDDVERFPAWIKDTPFPHIPVYGRLNDIVLQAEAARCGMGLAVLPCFFADQIEGLIQIPNSKPYERYDLWILFHPDLRDAARFRIFRAFLIAAIKEKQSELKGEKKSN